MSEPLTLIDKLWSAHEIVRRDDGGSLLWVDRHYVHAGCIASRRQTRHGSRADRVGRSRAKTDRLACADSRRNQRPGDVILSGTVGMTAEQSKVLRGSGYDAAESCPRGKRIVCRPWRKRHRGAGEFLQRRCGH